MYHGFVLYISYNIPYFSGFSNYYLFFTSLILKLPFLPRSAHKSPRSPRIAESLRHRPNPQTPYESRLLRFAVQGDSSNFCIKLPESSNRVLRRFFGKTGDVKRILVYPQLLFSARILSSEISVIPRIFVIFCSRYAFIVSVLQLMGYRFRSPSPLAAAPFF